MKKAVINCRRPKTGWQKEFFGDMNAYMLPFLGKPLIEFYIDWCVLSQISEILISYEDFDEEMSKFLADASKWGVSVLLVASPPRKPWKEEIILHNAAFIGDDDFVYIEDFFFPLYDKNAAPAQSEGCGGGKIEVCPNGHSAPLCPCECVDIDGIRAYYDLNMSLLRSKTDRLIMRGYSAQEGVFMGMNNVIMRRAELMPPFIMGDNVQIEEDSQIGPNTIIGDTCIIDRKTCTEDSIILDKTYIGADLNLRGKILYGRKLIDPIDGVQVTFSDNFFSSKVSSYSTIGFIKKCAGIFFALVLLLVLFVPFAFFFVIGRRCPARIRVPARQGTITVPRCERNNRLVDVWFRKFSLDKFIPLVFVAGGRISLIGDTLRDIRTSADIIARYKTYDPGAFTYADSLGRDGEYETLIDDLFYKHNRTLKTDMQLVLRSFVGRLLLGEKEVNSDEV